MATILEPTLERGPAPESSDRSFGLVFAVVFWSWVLGPPGAILAVPISLSLKRVADLLPGATTS